ncbi:hypothetical protein EG329_003692 [Mollisiaceae sp. DMI_Dod_QoI]|nr:hypothetical protein EG329_003692 [Helotiales sp. DMI_Dod_QoI]
MTKRLNSTRLHATDIHEVLTRSLRCACINGHIAAIRLSKTGPSASHLLASSRVWNRRYLLKVDIHIDDDIQSRQLFEIGDLCCSSADAADPSCDFPVHGIISRYWNGNSYILCIEDGVGVSSTAKVISLEQMLTSGGESKLSRALKDSIANILASSFLQIATTPWLSEHGIRKDRILFCHSFYGIDLKHPYLAQDFACRSTATELTKPQRNARNDILSLGILLLELYFGPTVEHVDFRRKHLSLDGNPYRNMAFSTILDWTANIAKVAGDIVAGVTERCVNCMFDEEADWDNSKFTQEVYSKVVEPLQRMCIGAHAD